MTTAKKPGPGPCQLRDFLGNRFVYAVISQRAGGLMIGIEMNPDQNCNYNCVYCYVNRNPAYARRSFNLRIMLSELRELLQMHRSHRLHQLPAFAEVPEDLMKLKAIALSGEGEPTLCPNFAEVMEELVALRNSGQWPDFKLVLITNGTGLNRAPVQQGLHLFRPTDEIWIKLDAGTDAGLKRLGEGAMPVGEIVDNIVALGQWRPVTIQSLFCSLDGFEPDSNEIDAYVDRLVEACERGANITEVQVYSIIRPPANPTCTRLPLNQLSIIAKKIRQATGLKVEVY